MSFWDFVETVKAKGTELVQVVSQDLEEFTTTIREDTVEVLDRVIHEDEAANEEKANEEEEKQEKEEEVQVPCDYHDNEQDAFDKVKNAFSQFFNEYETPEDGSSSSSSSSSSSPSSEVMDRETLLLHELQHDQGTYVLAPIEVEEFAEFSAQFDVQSRTEEISSLLASDQVVRQLHSMLVPDKVAYVDFWKRYFFRLARFRQAQQRRARLLERASQAQRQRGDQLGNESQVQDEERDADGEQNDIVDDEVVHDVDESTDSVALEPVEVPEPVATPEPIEAMQSDDNDDEDEPIEILSDIDEEANNNQDDDEEEEDWLKWE
jgi:BSD domain